MADGKTIAVNVRNLTSFLVAIILIISCQRGRDHQTTKLQIILNSYAHEFYALNPLAATANGINDYNDQLEIDISKQYRIQALALNRKYLDALKVLNYHELTESEKLSADILKFTLNIDIERLENDYGLYRPVDQFVFSFPQRFAVLGAGAGFIPFNSITDYRNFIRRMEHFNQWVECAISNMQIGLVLGNTNPRICMERVPAQLKPLFETPTNRNIFFQPLLKLPPEIDSVSRANLIHDYSEAIDTYVRPAYKKLHDFLVNSYIPNARQSAGIIENSNGKSEYYYWLRYYTTTETDPDKIYKLGLKEVSRIRNQMDSVRTATGFTGDLSAFFTYIKTDPKFFPFKSEQEILNRYKSYEVQMEPHLNQLFNLRPKASFEVRATEKFREAGANAQYNRPSRDGKRPGIFYETVRDPTTYNYFEMESLFMHEAIPGHHYQLAIQQEADIPEFRKTSYNGAYVEGWALYAESLGRNLGMYTDPYQYMGRLNNEMERAVRLVVDTGIHFMGWTREQAIAYVLENQPVAESVAEQRVERYMVTPGQAVSYKIGELKILELREKAKSILQNNFQIHEFHDELLKNGCLPLAIMEAQIEKWIEHSKNHPTARLKLK